MQSEDSSHSLSSSTVSSSCFYACHALEDNHSADVLCDPFETKKISWGVSISVFVVLVCIAKGASCSCVCRQVLMSSQVMKWLWGNDACNSFAVSSTCRFPALVICVGSDISSS